MTQPFGERLHVDERVPFEGPLRVVIARRAHLMTVTPPMSGCSALGTVTDPSAFW